MKINSTFFVKNPLLIHKNKSLSCNDKALVIALTVFSAILTAGVAAPFVFFALAKCLREKRIKQLKLINPLIPYLPPFAKPPLNFSMKKHVFQENRLEHGRLYYKGDVPILEINTDDPHQAGFVHGYLTAPVLNCMFRKINANLKKKKNIKLVLKKVEEKIPKEYLDEMKGIIEGYNAWATERGITNHFLLNLDKLIFAHLLPDSGNLWPQHEKMACTFISDDHLIGRTLDWHEKIFGIFSLVIVRNKKNVNLSVAGLVGTLTGMSKDLFVSMNEGSGYTDSIEGMPAVFYNRMCLETCKTVDEVSQKVLSQIPLGPYHLCTADVKQARAFHLFQGEWKSHVIRENNPLFVLNCWYLTPESIDEDDKREKVLKKIFRKGAADPLKRMQKALKTSPINCPTTLHKVLAIPGKMLQFAFAKSKAGSVPLTDLNFEELVS